jgi:hypothetical protein
MFPVQWLLTPTTEAYRASKRVRGKCVTWRCRRTAAFERTICEVCKSRFFRLNRPEHYAYSNLRASARKRGIVFGLTFSEFQSFVAGTDYVARRGKGDTDLSIDRIDTNGAYELGNLRIMYYADNVSHKYEGQPYELAEF